MPQFRYNANQNRISKNKRDAALKKAKKELPGLHGKKQIRWENVANHVRNKR